MLSALSAGDVERLRTALRLLLAPFEFPDPAAWRLAVCRHLLGWLNTDAVEMTLTRSGHPPMVIVGRWGPDTVAEYMETWHDRQEVDTGKHRRGLSVWVRDEVVPKTDFRRTRYFKDFCAPQRILDSAGAMHRLPDGEQVILHLNSSRNGAFKAGGRTATVLQLLQPALAPAVRVFQAAGAACRQPASIDAAPGAVALLTLDGRLLHATPRLAALLRDGDLAHALTRDMSNLARELGRLVRHPMQDPRFRPSRQIDTSDGRVVLSGSIIDSTILGPVPLCLVTVGYAPAPVSTPTLRRRFGLTDREVQVALLLARGARNREVAAALGVSEHTARRHTENVLMKIGVRSRAAVASVLASGSAVLDGDDSPPIVDSANRLA